MSHVTKYGEPYLARLRERDMGVTPRVLLVLQTGCDVCDVLQIKTLNHKRSLL